MDQGKDDQLEHVRFFEGIAVGVCLSAFCWVFMYGIYIWIKS